MRYKVLACKALFRELSLLASQTQTILDITYMRQSLHDTPDLLRRALQAEIDSIDDDTDLHSNGQKSGRVFDAILLGYGLCSNGVAGLSSRKHTLVVPRTDDCIGLYLGSYPIYREYFDAHPGTYWYNASWIENAYTPSEKNRRIKLEEYTALYGEDNALYLVDVETTTKNYNNAAYVYWDELPFPACEEYTRDAAAYYGWQFDRVRGDGSWLRDFIEGRHDDRFAIAPPGEALAPDYTGRVITSCPKEEVI
jgi:hypothetical protein